MKTECNSASLNSISGDLARLWRAEAMFWVMVKSLEPDTLFDAGVVGPGCIGRNRADVWQVSSRMHNSIERTEETGLPSVFVILGLFGVPPQIDFGDFRRSSLGQRRRSCIVLRCCTNMNRISHGSRMKHSSLRESNKSPERSFNVATIRRHTEYPQTFCTTGLAATL